MRPELTSADYETAALPVELRQRIPGRALTRTAGSEGCRVTDSRRRPGMTGILIVKEQ